MSAGSASKWYIVPNIFVFHVQYIYHPDNPLFIWQYPFYVLWRGKFLLVNLKVSYDSVIEMGGSMQWRIHRSVQISSFARYHKATLHFTLSWIKLIKHKLEPKIRVWTKVNLGLTN